MAAVRRRSSNINGWKIKDLHVAESCTSLSVGNHNDFLEIDIESDEEDGANVADVESFNKSNDEVFVSRDEMSEHGAGGKEAGGCDNGGKKRRHRVTLNQLKVALATDYENMEKENKFFYLPASTHTLLHTEPVCSVAFLISCGVATLSLLCLLLVLVNKISQGSSWNVFNIASEVGPGVKAAAYCGIFLGLLMEEEIPQALILMRSISRKSLLTTYPELSYMRFIFSCFVRLALGYLFLINLFFTIIQAYDVISIFFDILAIEFVQKLDDVTFELGRRGILGTRFCIATSIEYKVLTRTALERKLAEEQNEENADVEHADRKRFWNRINTSLVRILHEQTSSEFQRLHKFIEKISYRWMLKAVYFVNLGILLGGTIIVNIRQDNYEFHCESVSVTLTDRVWENAYVVTDGTDSSNNLEERKLVYSYFNGVYKITGRGKHGYPIYEEMNKIDGQGVYQQKVGAKIVYCVEEGAWVFQHEHIIKQTLASDEISECPHWLLRSPETKAYSLMDVPRDDWSVWTGIETPGNKVSITCNICKQNSDCNHRGTCGLNGECQCMDGFFGLHCEFEEACPELIDDKGEKYSLVTDSKQKPFLSYMKPMYMSQDSNGVSNESSTNLFDVEMNAKSDSTESENELSSPTNVSALQLVYSGLRWYGTVTENNEMDAALFSYDYHAFWDALYGEQTKLLSDPATGSTPVGVDFYEMITTQWDDYGPFGLLKPLHNMSGAGYFHCVGTNTSAIVYDSSTSEL